MAITHLSQDQRSHLIDWIGERPETVIAVAALRSCAGRVGLDGPFGAPSAALVESALVPGEPQAFGDSRAVLGLLADTDGWTCVDVVHRLDGPIPIHEHQLVRRLTPTEALELRAAEDDLLPDRHLVAAAAERRAVFAVVDGGVVVGYGGALAAGTRDAGVGVHVAGARRRRGIATACAAQACRSVQGSGLVPVWSTASDNAASLAVARKLGFVETVRLRFLLRGEV